MGNVKLTWLGHSCFALEKDDYRIVFDPYLDGSAPGYAPLRETADLVLCSHEHNDHGGKEHGAGVVELTKNAAEKECPWEISEIHSFHDGNQGRDRGENTIRVLDDGEFRIAHMGDLGCDLTEEQKEKLRFLDVMLVPIGGYFTMEPEDVKKLVEELQPTVVIPMHYRFGKYGYPAIAEADRYMKLCSDVIEYDGPTLELPEDGSPQTAMLRYLGSGIDVSRED
ncbi:MBL fold metallo-hydrolase [[Clostridium] aminophilum]|uniref:MBL fold metallo-hydrolase n=1 Tax=[Clostridium] aminophilum TaxID=1526 RepID=UPI003F9553A4